jgi:hypothetical protein
MATDPRLANPVLLALAARRAKQRQQTETGRRVVCRVVYYDASGQEPDELGESYIYDVPDNGPAWRAEPC